MKVVYVGEHGVVFHAAVIDPDGGATPRCGISPWPRRVAIFELDENDPDVWLLACHRCWPNLRPERCLFG